METMIIAIDRIRASLPTLTVRNGKPRTDAQLLTVAANNLNAAKVKRGETVGYAPMSDWSGLTSWTIETDADGKPLQFKVISAPVSAKRREIDTFLDSLDDVLPDAETDADAETDNE